MKIVLTPNFDKKNALHCTKQVCAFLIKHGVTVLLSQEYKELLSDDLMQVQFGVLNDLLNQCDCVIAIGGDGTILHTAKKAMYFHKPVLGVNVGRLGFLAALEAHEIHLLENVIKRKYVLNRRMMLHVFYSSNGKSKEYTALNDVVVSKGATSKMIELNVLCNQKYVISYRADGLIFSTPTGSSAYTLSAGGPIIDPVLDCISMTPICPQTLYNRTMIFDAENKLSVQAASQIDNGVYITIDGEVIIPYSTGDKLVISKSDMYVEFIDLQMSDFYEVINKKFLGLSQ